MANRITVFLMGPSSASWYSQFEAFAAQVGIDSFYKEYPTEAEIDTFNTNLTANLGSEYTIDTLPYALITVRDADDNLVKAYKLEGTITMERLKQSVNKAMGAGSIWPILILLGIGGLMWYANSRKQLNEA
jgi:hypothetical protein